MACGGYFRPGPPTISRDGDGLDVVAGGGGKHLEPVGAYGDGVWGWWSELLAGAAKSGCGQLPATRGARSANRRTTSPRTGLRGVMPDADLAIGGPHRIAAPVFRGAAAPRSTCTGPRCVTATIRRSCWTSWRRDDLPSHAPVMIFVPGGAWVHGSRILQGYALMAHPGRQRLGVSVGGLPGVAQQPVAAPPGRHEDGHRLGAGQRRPFGGDRDFVTIAGCSAAGTWLRWPA